MSLIKVELDAAVTSVAKADTALRDTFSKVAAHFNDIDRLLSDTTGVAGRGPRSHSPSRHELLSSWRT